MSSNPANVGSVYPKVDMTAGSSRFPDMEQEVQKYWKADDTFKASLEQTEGCPEYVFYDGPPFANGLPHYGHLLTGYVKDIVPRYRTMAGNHVPRVFGWDTHGLPAELEAEKQLGITDKGQIEEMGLEKFNEYCAKSVLEYTDEWEEYVNRQARWVDFENGYKTMDLEYMESVMWAFKELYDKGLIYQGFRVLPYSWAEHTSLSNQETRLDDSYKERQDPTVTVTFPVTGAVGSWRRRRGIGKHKVAGISADGDTARGEVVLEELDSQADATVAADQLRLADIMLVPPATREEVAAAYEPTIVPVSLVSYKAAIKIGEPFSNGDAVVFERADPEKSDAKRLIDFAAGLCFAARGKMVNLTSGMQTERRVSAIPPSDCTISTLELESAGLLG